MNDDSRAELEGTAQRRRGEGIVYDKGHAVSVRQIGQSLDVQYGNRGICDGLSEHGLGIRPESPLDLLVVRVRVHKGHLDPHLLHRDREQVDGTAVNRGGADHMVAGVQNIQDRQRRRRLSGGLSLIHI